MPPLCYTLFCKSKVYKSTEAMDVTSVNFFEGVSDVVLRKYSVCNHLLVTVVKLTMVLIPVSYPSEIHFTTDFALQNDKLSRLRVNHPHTSLSFVPD